MTDTVSQILDTLPALLFVLNEEGEVSACRASPFVAGHPLPARLPCPLAEIWPQGAAAAINRAIGDLGTGQPPQPFTYTLGNHGEPRRFTGRISKQGEGFLIMVLDTSAELGQEEERRRLYEQLRQNQKMEALGQLTGGIAHDFNNILASILGYADLTLDAAEAMGNEDLARYQREVIDAGERARDLIAQMLAFARAKANDAIALSPAPLIKEAAKILHAALPSTLSLHVSCDEETPAIRIDPAQLQQMIINLCLNARDAIGEHGTIAIALGSSQCSNHCSSCQERFEGECVEISVSDNGRGIDPAILDRIFDPFFTTGETGSRSGMGLAVVHDIVHKHGGHIFVESQPGHGTTVHVHLPAARAETAPAASLPADKAGAPLPKGTILVIDDEMSVARLQGELLRTKGFSAVVFTDPIHALEAYRLNPGRFDLVLADQTMPGMTGIEVAREILRLRPGTPIILNTAQGERDDSAAARAAGIAAYLTKPVPSERLLATITTLLQQHRKGAPR